MKKKKKKLNRRIIIYCIAFGVILSSSIAGLGINVYQRRSLQHYDEYILTILKYTEKQLDVKAIENWVKTKNDNNKEYKHALTVINEIKEASQYKMKNETGEKNKDDKKFQVNYLYIVSPKNIAKNEVMYIMSAFIQSDREADKTRKPDRLGDITKAGEGRDDLPQELMDTYKIMKEKKAKEVQYINDENDYYNNMRTGILPIINKEGEIVAYICVDVAFVGISDDVRMFISVVVFGTMILMVCFVLFFIYRMNGIVVKPITRLCANTFDFMRQSQEKIEPGNMYFKELNIKTGDEIEVLSDHLNKMTKELIAYMTDMEEITAERERFNTELDVAKLIQTQMIPCEFPAFPERTDFDIFALLRPAKEVGGDFYDFFLIDETHFCMVVASIAGSGITATLYLVIVKTLIKNYAQMGLSPEKIFKETNNHLCENNKTNRYATAFLGILDLHSGQFCYVNAYHTVPFLRGAGSKFEPLVAKRGFVLGGLGEVEYFMQEIKLMQGDMLFFYTDGMFKVMNRVGGGYNEDSLQADLNEMIMTEYELDQILLNINNKIIKNIEGIEQSSDITMMVFRYLGNY